MKQYIILFLASVSLSFFLYNTSLAQSVRGRVGGNNVAQTGSTSKNKQTSKTNQAASRKITKKKIRKIDHNLKHKFLTKITDPSFSDKLVKTFEYNPQRVYRINTTLLLNTIVIFPEGESISYVDVPSDNIYQIKVILNNGAPTNKLRIATSGTGVSSNLIVITDNNKVYNFLLLSQKLNSDSFPDLTIYFNSNSLNDFILNNEQVGDKSSSNTENKIDIIKTIYTIEDLKKGKNPNPQQLKDYLSIIDKLSPKQLKKINLINANYKIYTNKNLDNPIRVFDDGVFTYFKFKKQQNLNGIRIPAILAVENQIDQPVAQVTIYNYLVVKSTHKQFILKRDKEFICVEKIELITTR